MQPEDRVATACRALESLAVVSQSADSAVSRAPERLISWYFEAVEEGERLADSQRGRYTVTF
jgi:hypothetical protein